MPVKRKKAVKRPVKKPVKRKPVKRKTKKQTGAGVVDDVYNFIDRNKYNFLKGLAVTALAAGGAGVAAKGATAYRGRQTNRMLDTLAPIYGAQVMHDTGIRQDIIRNVVAEGTAAILARGRPTRGVKLIRDGR